MIDSNINHKYEKQIQAMVYAIQQYPLINRTKLMNFVFFVDLFASNMISSTKGDTILEDKYMKSDWGPVPCYGFELTSSVRTNEYFTVKKVYSGVGDVGGSSVCSYSFTLNNGIVPRLSDVGFTDQEIDILRLTLKTVKNNSAKVLSEKIHEYNLWKDTEYGAVINKDKFSLDLKETYDLNNFLHTVVYLAPINQIKLQIPKLKPIISEKNKIAGIC